MLLSRFSLRENLKTLDVAGKETPLMKQYNRIKVKHPDTVLLFRVGDFYETFGADAVAAAKVLNIVLTKRGNGSASEVDSQASRTTAWTPTCPNSSSPA